jgi:hypothetical protein
MCIQMELVDEMCNATPHRKINIIGIGLVLRVLTTLLYCAKYIAALNFPSLLLRRQYSMNMQVVGRDGDIGSTRCAPTSTQVTK